MITLRRSEDRGHTHIDWLDSRHSFSFGDYYDPANESFGALRVINEDWIKGGAGFPPNPRRGRAPGYEQKRIDPQSVHNHFARIAAPDPRENEVRLVQDAEIWVAKLDAAVEAIHPLAQGRNAWLQVAKGEI